MLKYLVLIALFAPFTITQAYSQASPCNLEADILKFDKIDMHLAAIEQAMKDITASNVDSDIKHITSEKSMHAQGIQDITSGYFMTQNLVPNAPLYMKQLLRLHLILVTTKDAKDSTDLTDVANIRANVKGFEKLYFKARALTHKHADSKK